MIFKVSLSSEIHALQWPTIKYLETDADEAFTVTLTCGTAGLRLTLIYMKLSLMDISRTLNHSFFSHKEMYIIGN